MDSIKATFTIPDAAIALNDVPFFDGGWLFSGGADLGLLWSVSEKTSLGLEVGARYHGDISDDDSALSGLAAAELGGAAAKEQVDALMDKGKDLIDSAADLIRERPLASFGVAFAAGWIIAKLARSND